MLLEWLQIVLFASIIIFLGFSIYYSFLSRRQKDPKKRGIYAARMNIFMGVMLIMIALTQLFFFHDSTFRRIFGIVCILMGLFNLFAGIRNHGHFERMKG
jgi:multidrug transporter EmrE-like cation transporter